MQSAAGAALRAPHGLAPSCWGGRARPAGSPPPHPRLCRGCRRQMSHSLSLDVMEMAEVAALLERLAAGLEGAPSASPPLSSSACSERPEPCASTCCCSLQGRGTHTASPPGPRSPPGRPQPPVQPSFPSPAAPSPLRQGLRGQWDPSPGSKTPGDLLPALLVPLPGVVGSCFAL